MIISNWYLYSLPNYGTLCVVLRKNGQFDIGLFNHNPEEEAEMEEFWDFNGKIFDTDEVLYWSELPSVKKISSFIIEGE